FPEFDLEVAWKLGSRLRELAVFRHLPVAIDVRQFGQPLFYAAMKGSTPDNADWVRRKGNVVARFHRSSYGVGLALKQTNSNLADKFALSSADFASHGGSVPSLFRDFLSGRITSWSLKPSALSLDAIFRNLFSLRKATSQSDFGCR